MSDAQPEGHGIDASRHAGKFSFNISRILYRLLCLILVHRTKFQKKKHFTHVKLTAAVLLGYVGGCLFRLGSTQAPVHDRL